ncbi:MAG: Riboflavin synthase [Candidatus Moanabacter tarae]|uniref:Riboflavin synthase n=1 Tax=Candidatus Moanibacter tarae TaxID=2200854 RepID=A0A2Z4AE41_9BACT|nr:MAG: Riboflavin synthase [Candidatus Moanabacter tarae]|tara:strand:- start:2680 stop:3345 length:666 start_codon:yes stop_codon:yes gene_type:complete
MFTGIIEEKGTVLRFEEGPKAWRLKVSANRIMEGLNLGESVAVNGCCLSVANIDQSTVSFDVVGETIRHTSLGKFKKRQRKSLTMGSVKGLSDPTDLPNVLSVNLERSMRSDGRFGGHFVTGHIDAIGRITELEARQKDYYLRVEPPIGFMKYVVYKGCIAIDGISLTVAEVDKSGFGVYLIPLTIMDTNIGERKVGDEINLEFDLLSKYVERLLPSVNKG